MVVETREDRLLSRLHEIGGRDSGSKDGQEALPHNKTVKSRIRQKHNPDSMKLVLSEMD